MNKTSFVYTLYIATTVEKAWQAIVDPRLARQYWSNENISDWNVGSPWEHRAIDGSGKVLMTGKILESSPPHRLVLTWAPPGSDAFSRVTFELETIEDMIRLRVTHDELEEGSDMHRGIAEGWPRVLSSMKSFLETGKPLDVWAGKKR